MRAVQDVDTLDEITQTRRRLPNGALIDALRLGPATLRQLCVRLGGLYGMPTNTYAIHRSLSKYRAAGLVVSDDSKPKIYSLRDEQGEDGVK